MTLNTRQDLMAWRLREGTVVGVWFCLVYIGSNWLTSLRAAHEDLPSFALAADAHVPFVPEAIFIYLSATPALLSSLFILQDRSQIRSLSIVLSIEIAIAGIVYAVWPVAASQTPQGEVSAIFQFADNLNLTYNSFPSLHVALFTTAAVVMMVPGQKARNILLALWAASIAFSTLLTYQHSIADVVGGGVLAAGGVLLFHILQANSAKRLAAHLDEAPFG